MFAALTLVLFGLAFVITAFVGGDDAYLARTEDGWIEKASVVLYFILAAGFVVAAVAVPWQRGFYAAFLMLVFAMREMDFDEFTSGEKTQKLTSTRYWRSEDFSIFHKLIVLLVLVATAVALWKLCRGGWSWLRTSLAAGKPYAVSVLGVVFYILLSSVLDNRVDWDALDNPVVLFFSLAEECVELGIPILLGVALVQWLIYRDPAEDPPVR